MRLKIQQLIEKIAQGKNAFQQNILQQLADEDPVKRRSAVWSVYSESIPSAGPIICALLQDKDVEVRLSAIAVCGQMQIDTALSINADSTFVSLREQDAWRSACDDLQFHPHIYMPHAHVHMLRLHVTTKHR